MISNVTITNRYDAKELIASIRNQNKNVCWITISNKHATPLVHGSNKRILVCKFDDINISPITHNQMRRIKNFIFNHHVNTLESFILVINCHWGISRSAAIGMFCQHNLNIPVKFEKPPFPNVGVMRALGVDPSFWANWI